MKRRMLTLAAALGLAVCLAVGADAAGVVANGYCGADSNGRNLTWTLNNDGKLAISGTGDMAYWESWEDIPWYARRANIRSLVIGEGVTGISEGAFYNLTALTSAVLPASLKTFDGSAFVSCTSLTGIEVSDASEDFAAVDGIVFSKDGTELVCYPCGKPDAAYTVPDGVVSVGFEAFKECPALTELTLPEGVNSIGELAFSECRALTVVTLPASLTEIGDWAFRACNELADVYYGGNVFMGQALEFEQVFFGIEPTIHYEGDVVAAFLPQYIIVERHCVTVSVPTPEAAVLVFACYDADGRFLGVERQPLDAETMETLTFYDRSGTVRVKLMLLGDENLPLCAAAEASLIDIES